MTTDICVAKGDVFVMRFYVAVIAPRDEPVASQTVGEQSARHAER